MTPQKKLITIMRIKNDLLNKHMIEINLEKIPDKKYFTKEDEKSLEELTDENAIFVINRMIHLQQRYKDKVVYELTPALCPFCVLYDMDCKNCDYYKNRNNISCTNQHSDFYICNQFYKNLSIDLKIKISTILEILKKE